MYNPMYKNIQEIPRIFLICKEPSKVLKSSNGAYK